MGQRRNWAVGFCLEYKCSIIAAANLVVQLGTRQSGINTLHGQPEARRLPRADLEMNFRVHKKRELSFKRNATVFWVLKC